MPNDQEKVFKHQGEAFSCVENGAEMGLDLQFPLYFALLHKISIVSYSPPPMGIFLFSVLSLIPKNHQGANGARLF